MKQVKRIRVRSESNPVMSRIPVEHDTSCKSMAATSAQKEQITVTPSARSEWGDDFSLQDWTEHFSPSIDKLLRSSEESFMPKAVSIEQETVYRDQDLDAPGERSKPRRVRVTRRRVTLFGSVRQEKP